MQDPLRLLQVIVGEPEGGAERFFVKLALALAKRGLSQKLVIQRDPNRAAELREGGCDVVEMDFGSGIKGLAARYRLRRIAGEFKPDAALAWMNRAARRMPRGPFATAGRLGGYYPTRFYRKCDWLVCNTPDLVRFVVEDGWPADRTTMISNFGEISPAAALSRAQFDTPEDAPLLLAMGRLHPDKGFDVLLKALAGVPGAYLWLAGAGHLDGELRALASELGVEERVRFLGWRDDQAALLGACDICVVPSRHEPLSNVVVEAWSLGVPVVAAASEGPSWLIRDGETGLICPVDNAPALSTALSRAIGDTALRRHIAEGGHARWRAEFSEDAICRQYLEFFQRIAAARQQHQGH